MHQLFLLLYCAPPRGAPRGGGDAALGAKSSRRAARSQVTGAHSPCVMRCALVDITWGKHSTEEMLLSKEGAAKGVHTEQPPCGRAR